LNLEVFKPCYHPLPLEVGMRRRLAVLLAIGAGISRSVVASAVLAPATTQDNPTG